MSWYVDFFRGDYQRVFAHDAARSAEEAAFAARALGLRRGERVLDLCCGEGRHLAALRAQGYAALGVDLHRPSLQGLVAACGDMRRIPVRTASLAAVTSFFSSFGYLESDAEDEAVLLEIARVLAPRGAVLLDLLNRENALSGLAESIQRVEDDGTLIVERRSFDAVKSWLSVGFVVVAPSGEQRTFAGHRLRLYTLAELRGMLERAGLTLEAVYGGFDGAPYALDSVRMMAVARLTSSPRSR